MTDKKEPGLRAVQRQRPCGLLGFHDPAQRNVVMGLKIVASLVAASYTCIAVASEHQWSPVVDRPLPQQAHRVCDTPEVWVQDTAMGWGARPASASRPALRLSALWAPAVRPSAPTATGGPSRLRIGGTRSGGYSMCDHPPRDSSHAAPALLSDLPEGTASLLISNPEPLPVAVGRRALPHGLIADDELPPARVRWIPPPILLRAALASRSTFGTHLVAAVGARVWERWHEFNLTQSAGLKHG